MTTSMTAWIYGVLIWGALTAAFFFGWVVRSWFEGVEPRPLPPRLYCEDGGWWHSEAGQRALEADMATGDPWPGA